MASCTASLAVSARLVTQQRQQCGAVQPFKAGPLRCECLRPAPLRPARWRIAAARPTRRSIVPTTLTIRRLQAPRLRRAAAERRPLAVRAEGGNGAYVEEQSFRIERVRCCLVQCGGVCGCSMGTRSARIAACIAAACWMLPAAVARRTHHNANHSARQVSFGSILAPIGVSFMVYGFGAFFNLLPGGDVSSLLLIYGAGGSGRAGQAAPGWLGALCASLRHIWYCMKAAVVLLPLLLCWRCWVIYRVLAAP